MQRYEIPTHLEVEDQLFAGLSPRQLLLLIMGIGLGYSFWQRFYHVLPLPLVVLLAALPGLASIALATLRPDDRHIEQWLLALLRYYSLARVCLLDRAEQGAQEIDLIPEGLAALEAEWQALRLAVRTPAPQETDEWGMSGNEPTQASPMPERASPGIGDE